MKEEKVKSEITLAVERLDGFLDIEALWHGRRVGYAWCTVDVEARLALNDLVVKDEFPIRFPIAHNLLILLGMKCRTRDFRGHGIGRMLMQEVIVQAKAMGAREICGSVTKEDIGNTPHLLDWYQRLGFAVSEPDSECIRTATNKISMRLATVAGSSTSIAMSEKWAEFLGMNGWYEGGQAIIPFRSRTSSRR